MIQTMEILPGIRLHCCRDNRFKQGALSIQFVRPMCKEESALNALLPAVLLRGTEKYPDLRAITLHLDDLYGAAISAQVRRVGDYQTTGIYCNFIEDRFALAGDEILTPMVNFIGQLLFDPVLENGAFSEDFVASEKKNLIATIESEKNDKRLYASACLLRRMCQGDSFALPRLGEKKDVQAITPQSLYDHYQRILRESPVELFYVGSGAPKQIAKLLKAQFESITRQVRPLAGQSSFQGGKQVHEIKVMDVAQAKLCMGFVTPITNRAPEFAAMQVFNAVLGGSMTSKLFMNVREKLSLCYSISTGYYGSKGLLTLSAGIDSEKDDIVRQEIFRQLDACRNGDISAEELAAAKEAICSGLRTVHDSPGAIEGYYAVAALSGLTLTLNDYIAAVENVTVDQVAIAANALQYHSSFLLRGGQQ